MKEDKLVAKIKKLQEENIFLREKLKTQRIRYQERIDKLELDKQKLKQKLETKHIIDKPFKYVLDNYPEITKKVFDILNKHNVQFINRKELAKRIILLLEGDDIQKPIFTKAKMMSYLNLVDSFTLQEYRQIKYAPIIKSDKALFENYEQTVRTLKPLKMKSNKTEEFSFINQNDRKAVIRKCEIEEDDEDEEIDMTDVYKT